MDSEKLIATRESFGKALAELEDDRIVVLDADLETSTKTEYFKEKNPNRFIQNGIAEADMIGTSAGLATCGKIPFAATFSAFATGRCYDQIRTSIAYPKLNVKICGTHSGITVGEDGATHQMLEDISLMRSLPNMVVISPSDDISTKSLVKEIAKYEGPVYLRLSRMNTPVIYKEDEKFEIGKGRQIGNGKDATIFATGDIVSECIKAQEMLKNDNINIRVVDMYSIKPIDEELILKCANETEMLFSVEDHNIIGGLGTAIADVLCEKYPKKLVKIGIPDCFGKSGRPSDLIKYFNLNAESIVEKVKEEKSE